MRIAHLEKQGQIYTFKSLDSKFSLTNMKIQNDSQF